jgi:hypothetical protein
MRRTFAVFFTLCLLVAAATAAEVRSGRDSLVITFKDGRQQTIPVSDISRIEFKGAPVAAASSSTPPASSENQGHFMGRWRVGDGQGNTFIITLSRDGKASKSIGNSRGTWSVVNGEAHIMWNDGWRDAIRKVGNKYEKVAFSPGHDFNDSASNIADAKSLDPI